MVVIIHREHCKFLKIIPMALNITLTIRLLASSPELLIHYSKRVTGWSHLAGASWMPVGGRHVFNITHPVLLLIFSLVLTSGHWLGLDTWNTSVIQPEPVTILLLGVIPRD